MELHVSLFLSLPPINYLVRSKTCYIHCLQMVKGYMHVQSFDFSHPLRQMSCTEYVSVRLLVQYIQRIILFNLQLLSISDWRVPSLDLGIQQSARREWLLLLETSKTYSRSKVDCFHHMLKV